MAEQKIRVTMVNHVGIDIAAAPDVVWRAIREDYVEARKFRENGGSIEALDDAAAILGGYRMRVEQDGIVIDDRICHITELDQNARRLSMFADYLLVPGGMQVYATYHAQEIAGGTRYALDCHSSLSIDANAGDGRADVAATVARMTSQADTSLVGYLEGIKAKVEETA